MACPCQHSLLYLHQHVRGGCSAQSPQKLTSAPTSSHVNYWEGLRCQTKVSSKLKIYLIKNKFLHSSFVTLQNADTREQSATSWLESNSCEPSTIPHIQQPGPHALPPRTYFSPLGLQNGHERSCSINFTGPAGDINEKRGKNLNVKIIL